MKNRNFFLAAAASILALAGCNKEIDYGPAKVEVDKAEIEVTQGAGSVSVSLNATIDWAAKVDGDDADWLDISPASGGPSLEAQTLTIKYTENTGINREATILVQGDVLHKTYINVKQAGPKGDEDSCTIAEFIQKGDTQHEYVLEGKVSNVIHSSYTTFNINDDSGSILVYSFTETSKELAETVKNGGVIKIRGTYQYYESKSQHEVVNAEILSYEAPMAVDPSTIETITVKDFLDKADPTTTYRLVGTVKGFNSQYCSFDLEDSTGSIYVYSVDAESKAAFADKFANGKKVTLTGVYYWYENKNDASKSKAEINPATIEKVEDGEGGDDGGTVDPSTIEKITVAEFLEKADPNTTYRLVGTVKGFNSQYCSFDLEDSTGSIYVYKIDDASKTAFADKLANGKKVTLTGKYYWYENKNDASKSKAEINPATIEKVEDGDGGDDGGEGTVDPSTIKTITVAEFLKNADPSTTYRLVGTVEGFNAKYCSFDLKDSTGSIYVYSVDNASKTAFADKMANGKKVTITGKYFWYENSSDSSKSKAEINPATIEKVEDGEGGDDGGEGSGDDGGQGGAPTEFTKVTVAEFLAASPSTTKWYQLTGEITNIANTTYGNFTIKDETGEVYIYGLTKTYVPQNDKSFSEIGLKKGDVVTLNGLRSEYNGTIETAGTPPAFYVSHTAGEGEKFPEGSVILSFPDDNSSSNALTSKQYETEWTAKSGSNEFKIFAFNNNGWKNDWAFIRAGRKSVESTATIATSTKIAAKISKVVVTFDSIETGDVKSIKVISASDAAFTADVAEVSVTPAQGDVESKIAAPAGNKFYKLVIDCKASSKDKNGFVQVSRVAYIAAE